MNDEPFSLYHVISKDPRYPAEAYHFVREALKYASDGLELNAETHNMVEHHLTGQQLCEAIRLYAINQFGFMAKVVLTNWNIDKTDCFGDIVYNLIELGAMKKSDTDKKSDFDGVYEFDDVFQVDFDVCSSRPST